MEKEKKLTEDDYCYLKIDEAVNPIFGLYFQRYHNYWWVVHPERGLVFYKPRGRTSYSFNSPQCSMVKKITEGVAKYLPFDYEVKKIEQVWIPINISDYKD